MRVLGIDLGTTNSCVAMVDDGDPRVIADRDGYKTMPSMIAISKAGKRLVGHRAKRQAITNAHNTVFAAKRFIGRKWDSAEVAYLRETYPCKLAPGPQGDVRIELQDKLYAVAEISSMILQEMRLLAEEYCGETIDKAVITVPAYFNDSQRQATKDAGRIAGLDVIGMINEPTAAAIAYGYERGLDNLVAVYDLGGGTFDISILRIIDGAQFEVIATAGDSFLGGEDFDDRLIQHLTEDFMARNQVDLTVDPVAMQRIKDSSEKAKCELSARQTSDIQLPFIATSLSGEPLHLNTTVTLEQLEQLCDELVSRTLDICGLTLEKAGLRAGAIEDVLLVGGMTRMPLVQRKVAEFFGRQPSKGVHPDEAVAIGACIQAATLLDPEPQMLLLDVTPHGLGLMGYGQRFLEFIGANSTIPTSHCNVFTTSRDGQTTVKILVMQALGGDEQNCELLGEFSLTGLRAAPAREVQVEVEFSIDRDGIVSVSARDLETGRQQSIQVASSSALTDEEMVVMIEQAEDYMLDRRMTEQFEAEKQQVEKLISQVVQLFPKVKHVGTSSDFGPGAMEAAIRNAQGVVDAANDAIYRRDLEALRLYEDKLKHTHKMFAGILTRPR